MLHLPIHASWLNQIETYVSILRREALTPNDFRDLDAHAARITSFEDHCRGIAQPFEWTFTCAKLDALLARLTAHEPDLRLAAQSYAATSTSAGVTIAIVRGRLSRSRPT